MARLQGGEGTGWQPAGVFAGSQGASWRAEGFAVKVTGLAYDRCRVEYWAHAENEGDIGPKRAGEYCGSCHKRLRAEAILVRFRCK